VGVRDPDLLKKISESPSFLRDTVVAQCERLQSDRDKLAALTAVKRRRVQTNTRLQEEGAQRDDLRHIHSVLAICSLPYTRQDISVREWKRTQGKMSLMVTAGKLLGRDGKWEEQPLPYGSRARLLLLHTCSEALRQKSPVIEIEDSLSGFMRAMGLKVTGGKNGTLTSFKQQINALAACSMQHAACSMQIGVWDGQRAKTVKTQPFSAIDVWFPKVPDQHMLWSSKLTFSQDFFSTLTKHALPVNMHAVRAFAGSSRKLDMLFWLGYRINSERAVSISWEALQEQFGWGYARADNFRRDFAREIAEIKEVFPKLPVKLSEVGVAIRRGRRRCWPFRSRHGKDEEFLRINGRGTVISVAHNR